MPLISSAIIKAFHFPVILATVFLCVPAFGFAAHNVSAVELYFYSRELPADTSEEYRTYIEDIRTGFERLDSFTSSVNGKTEEEKSLGEIRITAFLCPLLWR